ncbi:hypothetical protein, partial [Deinococcus roseus]|uniref:hypothetical protein n=1 Tax=Deinococcus roseus TaxID=392414 RepID=UPI001E51C0F2
PPSFLHCCFLSGEEKNTTDTRLCQHLQIRVFGCPIECVPHGVFKAPNPHNKTSGLGIKIADLTDLPVKSADTESLCP